MGKRSLKDYISITGDSRAEICSDEMV